MQQFLVLEFLLQILRNLCGAVGPSIGVALANGILFYTNPAYYARLNINNFRDAITDGLMSCWPLWIFCSFIPVSWSLSFGLGTANIVLCCLVTLSASLNDEKWGNGRRQLEHWLILGFFIFAACFLLCLAFEEKGQESTGQARDMNAKNLHMKPLEMIIVLLTNAAKSLPVLIALGCAFTASFFFNSDAHRFGVCPNTMKMTWENYKVHHAFAAGVFFEDVGPGWMIFCSIIPVSWCASFCLASAVFLLPFVVALAAYDDKDSRLIVEVRMMYFLNAAVAIAILLQILLSIPLAKKEVAT
jgi:hypothetical protein